MTITIPLVPVHSAIDLRQLGINKSANAKSWEGRGREAGREAGNGWGSKKRQRGATKGRLGKARHGEIRFHGSRLRSQRLRVNARCYSRWKSLAYIRTTNRSSGAHRKQDTD